MSDDFNIPVSDEMLAAYLDGRLDEEQSEYVEKAIENSPELQWTVDRWVEEQTSAFLPSTAESLRVNTRNTSHRKKWAMAASILIPVAILLPLILNRNNIDVGSGMPTDFPVSGRYESELPNSNTEPTTLDIDTDSEDGFSYQYEVYKTAAIITWDQPIKSANCRAYSNDSRESFYIEYDGKKSSNDFRIFVVPLSYFNESHYPLKLKLEFSGSDFTYSDSIFISLDN